VSEQLYKRLGRRRRPERNGTILVSYMDDCIVWVVNNVKWYSSYFGVDLSNYMSGRDIGVVQMFLGSLLIVSSEYAS
jgi:hypothetical protein